MATTITITTTERLTKKRKNMDSLIRFSLRYRALVVLGALVVLVYGSYLAAQLPIDVLPDLDRTRVVLLTEAPGLAAEEVETLISQPLEIALLGAAGVEDVRSESAAGISIVYVEFGWGAETRASRQMVQERLTSVQSQLPPGVTPYMAPPSSILGQVIMGGLSFGRGPGGGELAVVEKNIVAERIGEKITYWFVHDRHRPETWERTTGPAQPPVFRNEVERQRELRTLADWVVRPRLRRVGGVAEVFMQGGERKQYQVTVDPLALVEYGVTLDQVEHALRENNLNASGGFAVQGDRERPVRVIGRLGPDPARVVKELQQVPVLAAEPRPILLSQVATIAIGDQPKRGDGGVNGQPGVVLVIAKQPGVDTRDLTDRVTQALREVEAALPVDIRIDPGLFQLKNFIDRGVYNVIEALIIGAVLVLIVLFLFLLNVRTTFITLTAIPLSLVMTAIVFRLVSWATGTPLGINVMTLGGIAVAMGELVDDAIVDVENIYRRLGENAARPDPQPTLHVVYEASREIRSAIVFGTAVVILVFLPLFALSGVEGRLFTPLGIAYIVSILASLGVSLTVTPVLSYYLLGRTRKTHHHDGWVLGTLKAMFTPIIRFSMKYAGTLTGFTWVLVAFSAVLLTRLGADFLPPFDEGSVQVNVTLPVGSSLAASNEACRIVDKSLETLRRTPENPRAPIVAYFRRTGRAELDEHAAPVSATEYILSINPDAEIPREEMLTKISQILQEQLPGVDLEAEQPLSHLISHMLSGVSAQVAIKIHGDDLNTLRSVATQIRSAIRDVPGLRPPVIEAVRQSPELHVRPRPEDLAQYGISREQVARFVQMALLGEPVSQVLEGQRRFDLVVRLEDPYRNDPEQLGQLRLPLPSGAGTVKLADLADIGEELGPNIVKREDARRRLVVRCNAHGRDLASVVADIQARVRQVSLPEGYFVEYGGQFESQQSATRLIIVLAAVAGLGMAVVLFLAFPSLALVMQILNALPAAFIGGVLALVLTGQSLTVAAMVGFISLGGIAVRNGILLMSHYLHLLRQEGEVFNEHLVLRGSLERLAPVLMTALTAGIGLIPLVWAGNEPGREVLYPVATVILGGLVTSTACEFFLRPGLFFRFGRTAAERLAQPTSSEEI
jgi:HME family heavy-metal exporter